MELIADIITELLSLYLWVIIAYVVVSWLVAFNVIHPTNLRARQLIELLQKLTDPVLKPIQKYVPPVAGIDLSPIIAIIAIQILIRIINYLAYSV